MGSTLAQRIKQMTIKIKNLSGEVIFNVEADNLSGANLSWANLRGADLSEADLSGADFREANLN